jgi:hypothetical protein
LPYFRGIYQLSRFGTIIVMRCQTAHGNSVIRNLWLESLPED